MNIDQLIEQRIAEQISIALDNRLNELVDRLSTQFNRPAFDSWGRYLTTKQAMQYTGYSSVNGFKEMCRIYGIEKIHINSRVIRYDRYALDKINIQTALQQYLNSF